MSRILATSIGQTQFRQGDTPSIRTQKLELLRQAATSSLTLGRRLYISITDGLPTADPASPLLRYRVKDDWTLDIASGDAGIAATAPAAFRVKLNGAANGFLTFTGTTLADTIVNRSYPAGSLFELYPPSVADVTLDDVSISIPILIA